MLRVHMWPFGSLGPLGCPHPSEVGGGRQSPVSAGAVGAEINGSSVSLSIVHISGLSWG